METDKLTISPYISLHLPVSPCISQVYMETDKFVKIVTGTLVSSGSSK